MSKKGWGKLITFAAVSGAVAAGVSYVLQYKTYHKELEKDFREFEDSDEDESSEKDDEPAFDPRKVNRNYICLNSSTDEFKVAAKDMAQATKNVLKDAGSLFSDTAHEAMSAAVDTAQIALNTMKAKKNEFMDSRSDEDEDYEDEMSEDEGFLDDDYVDDDDLYDYERMEQAVAPVKPETEPTAIVEEPQESEEAASPKETATIEDDTAL